MLPSSPSRLTHVALAAAVVGLSGALAWQTWRLSRAASAPSDLAPGAEMSARLLAEPVDDAGFSIVQASLLDSLDVLAFEAAAFTPQDGDSSAGEQRDTPPPTADGRRWDGRDHHLNHAPRPMSPALIEACLDVADEVDTSLGHQLREARQKAPAEFDRQMKQGGFGRRLASLVELKQRDPDLYQAKLGELSQAVQIDRVARQLREAKRNQSAGEIEMYEAQLRRLLQVQFAMAIKARGELLCRLEDRIVELRAEMERDVVNFQNIIDARMKLLAGEPAATADKAPATPQAGR
jgi:hypothetical protein